MCVHYSVHNGKSHVNITHDALDLTVQGILLVLVLPPWTWDLDRTGRPCPLDIGLHRIRTSLTPAPAPNLAWPPLLVTSGGQDWYLFKLVHLGLSTSTEIWWPRLEICPICSLEDPQPVLPVGGYWSTYGRSKRVVHILLECCFVFNFSEFSKVLLSVPGYNHEF